MCVCVRVGMCMHTYVCASAYRYVFVCIHVFVCLHVLMCVCVCVHVYVHAYSTKHWWEKTLANLANTEQFAKVLPTPICILKLQVD